PRNSRSTSRVASSSTTLTTSGWSRERTSVSSNWRNFPPSTRPRSAHRSSRTVWHMLSAPSKTPYASAITHSSSGAFSSSRRSPKASTEHGSSQIPSTGPSTTSASTATPSSAPASPLNYPPPKNARSSLPSP